jgi:hypothetical protein
MRKFSWLWEESLQKDERRLKMSLGGRTRTEDMEGTEDTELLRNGAEFKAPIEHAGSHLTAHLKHSSRHTRRWRDQRNRFYLTEQGRFCFFASR